MLTSAAVLVLTPLLTVKRMRSSPLALASGVYCRFGAAPLSTP